MFFIYIKKAEASSDNNGEPPPLTYEEGLKLYQQSIVFKPECSQPECTYLTRGMEIPPPPPPPKPKPVIKPNPVIKVDLNTSLHDRAKSLVGSWGGWCVQFAKDFLGRSGETWGNAWNIVPNITADQVQVGDIILIGKLHAGIVTQIYMKEGYGKTFSYVDSNGRDSNLSLSDGIIRMQDISLGDPELRGFNRT